jgi:hypothetical protein
MMCLKIWLLGNPSGRIRYDCRRCGWCCFSFPAFPRPDGGGCKYLAFEDGKASCSIHESKPNECLEWFCSDALQVKVCGRWVNLPQPVILVLSLAYFYLYLLIGRRRPPIFVCSWRQFQKRKE